MSPVVVLGIDAAPFRMSLGLLTYTEGKVAWGKQMCDKLAELPSVSHSVMWTAVPRTYFQYIDRFYASGVMRNGQMLSLQAFVMSVLQHQQMTEGTGHILHNVLACKWLTSWKCGPVRGVSASARPGCPTVAGEGPDLLWWPHSRAAHWKITISGVPVFLNDCASFVDTHLQIWMGAADWTPIHQTLLAVSSNKADNAGGAV